MSLTLDFKPSLLGSYAILDFNVEVQNTGDVPLVYAEGTLGQGTFGQKDILFAINVYDPTGPYEILKGTVPSGFVSEYWKVGTSYPVSITLTFSDGNKQTIQSSVVAQPNSHLLRANEVLIIRT